MIEKADEFYELESGQWYDKNEIITLTEKKKPGDKLFR